MNPLFTSLTTTSSSSTGSNPAFIAPVGRLSFNGDAASLESWRVKRDRKPGRSPIVEQLPHDLLGVGVVAPPGRTAPMLEDVDPFLHIDEQQRRLGTERFDHDATLPTGRATGEFQRRASILGVRPSLAKTGGMHRYWTTPN